MTREDDRIHCVATLWQFSLIYDKGSVISGIGKGLVTNKTCYQSHDPGLRGGSYNSNSKTLTLETLSLFTFSRDTD